MSVKNEIKLIVSAASISKLHSLTYIEKYITLSTCVNNLFNERLKTRSKDDLRVFGAIGCRLHKISRS